LLEEEELLFPEEDELLLPWEEVFEDPVFEETELAEEPAPEEPKDEETPPFWQAAKATAEKSKTNGSECLNIILFIQPSK